MTTSVSAPPPPDPATRLAALLKSKRYIPFHKDIPDKEFAYITLSIYGAIETNELFVKITNGTVTFVEVIESPLIYPGMGDRMFGMDVSDSQVAFELANTMWKKHQAALVRR